MIKVKNILFWRKVTIKSKDKKKRAEHRFCFVGIDDSSLSITPSTLTDDFEPGFHGALYGNPKVVKIGPGKMIFVAMWWRHEIQTDKWHTAAVRIVCTGPVTKLAPAGRKRGS
jgi:hypothetical protein